MKCHYEILELERDAEGGEIKSQYRKLALKWHPDKNLQNTDYAKEQFQLVQQAYEVLSDPQERAWYDKHREQILRASSEFEDNCLDVFQFFTTTCFKGYNDEEGGFYTVYRKVFEELLKEDEEFFDDHTEFDSVPHFGDSQSDYSEVVGPFYTHWSSYTTKKNYMWLDPVNVTDIKNRKFFKLAEKENKKVRSQAKKERNEEIRNLVAFVKKRDKRVQAQTKLEQAKILENRKKAEEISKQKRLERKQEMENGAMAEWSKFDNVKSELEAIERHLAAEFGEEFSNSEEEEEKINDHYCVACNKIFKTGKALENHEASKKHKENVELLRATMSDEESLTDEQSVKSDDEHFSDESDKVKKQKKKKKNVINIEEEEEHCDIAFTKSDSDDSFVFESKSKQKKKVKKLNGTKKIAKDEIQQNGSKKPFKKKEEDIDISHCCVSCKTTFPSKNKLFDHLKKTGHGVHIPKGKNVK